MEVCAKWIADAEKSDTKGHFSSLKEAVEGLNDALSGLGSMLVPAAVNLKHDPTSGSSPDKKETTKMAALGSSA